MRQSEVEQLRKDLHREGRNFIASQSHDSRQIEGLDVSAMDNGIYFLLSHGRLFIPDPNSGDPEFRQIPLWTEDEEIEVMKLALDLLRGGDPNYLAPEVKILPDLISHQVSLDDLKRVIEMVITQNLVPGFTSTPRNAANMATKIVNKIKRIDEKLADARKREPNAPPKIRGLLRLKTRAHHYLDSEYPNYSDEKNLLSPDFWQNIVYNFNSNTLTYSLIQDSATFAEALGVPYEAYDDFRASTIKLLQYIATHPELFRQEVAVSHE